MVTSLKRVADDLPSYYSVYKSTRWGHFLEQARNIKPKVTNRHKNH